MISIPEYYVARASIDTNGVAFDGDDVYFMSKYSYAIYKYNLADGTEQVYAACPPAWPSIDGNDDEIACIYTDGACCESGGDSLL